LDLASPRCKDAVLLLVFILETLQFHVGYNFVALSSGNVV